MSDKWSRVMPARKDFITVVTNGVREQVQKRLLLNNIKELYEKFKEEFPETEISLSRFTKLRPRCCIPVGKKGSHNVCVCRMHQNMKLKFIGLNNSLNQNNGVQYNYKTSEILSSMVCENSTTKCFLLDCKNCPGAASFLNELDQLLNDHNVKEIYFKSWTSTDRSVFIIS